LRNQKFEIKFSIQSICVDSIIKKGETMENLKEIDRGGDYETI